MWIHSSVHLLWYVTISCSLGRTFQIQLRWWILYTNNPTPIMSCRNLQYSRITLIHALTVLQLLQIIWDLQLTFPPSRHVLFHRRTMNRNYWKGMKPLPGCSPRSNPTSTWWLHDTERHSSIRIINVDSVSYKVSALSDLHFSLSIWQASVLDSPGWYISML